MKKFYRRTFLLLLCGLVAGCGQANNEGNPIVLEIGQEKITLNQLKKDIAFQTAELVDVDQKSFDLRGPLLDSMIDYYLIQDYAQKHGISVTQAELLRAIGEIKKDYSGNSFEETLLRRYISVEQWKQAIAKELLRKKIFDAITMHAKPPSSREIEQYYEMHIGEFQRPSRVKFRQIVTRSLDKAKEALARIKRGETIATLAPLYSYSPEATRGGEVGWIEKGQLVQSMEKALFSLPVGKISPIVRSPYGYHIFQVMAVDPGGVQPIEEVVDLIQSKLYGQARERFFQQWLSKQRTRTKIKIMTKALEDARKDNEKG